MSKPTNSLIIPIYKNEHNIPELLAALRRLHSGLSGDLEVVFVVDGSPDKSLALLQHALPIEGFPSQLLELSRNFGSFAAIRRGMEAAKGVNLAVMAADLQEPAELILNFFSILDEGTADLVLGQRTSRSDGLITNLMSNVFWSVYKRYVVPDMPNGGVDIFGCNSQVRDDLLTLRESNSSLVSQLLWLGHRRQLVPYERSARKLGKSSWTFSGKIRYMLDSIFAFSDMPIFLLLFMGMAGILASVTVSVIVFVAWLLGYITVAGYTPVMLLISMVGSILIFGQGVIGSYLWRAHENTKRRPLCLVKSCWTFGPPSSHTEPQGLEQKE